MRRLLVGVLAIVLGAVAVLAAPAAGTPSCVAGPAGAQMCETAVQVTADVLVVTVLGLVSIAAGGRIVWTELVP